MKSIVASLVVNGEPREFLAAPGTTLLNLLRSQADLLGTRRGCEQGGCGACTVLVDGTAKLACLIPVECIEGAAVLTVEGLGAPDALHPLQQAFLDAYATQCGFCAPGMLMALKALLDADPAPDRAAVASAISGNVCRCTGYEAIIEAALLAADRLRPPVAAE
jgi:carbon-monoxide dehydrogenase small subunit